MNLLLVSQIYVVIKLLQMEPEAVIQAKESDLKYLGIEKMGDILPLKTFGGNCIKQNEKHNIINEMKRKLLPFVSMNIEREKK